MSIDDIIGESREPTESGFVKKSFAGNRASNRLSNRMSSRLSQANVDRIMARMTIMGSPERPMKEFKDSETQTEVQVFHDFLRSYQVASNNFTFLPDERYFVKPV